MEKQTTIWTAITAALVILLIVGAIVVHSANTEKAQTIESLKTEKDGLVKTVASVQTENKNLKSDVDATKEKVSALEAAQANSAAAQAKATEDAAAAQAELEKVKAQLAAKPTKGITEKVGEVIDNLFLNDVVNFVVDDQDVAQLQDTSVDFDGSNYDIHEEFASSPGNVLLAASLTEDEDFGATPRLTLANRGALVYTYVFDEPVTVADITNDEPLKIKFLGEDMELVKVTPGEVTIRSGQEEFLYEGESKVVNGKTVKLEIVGDTGAYVSVDGVSKVIKEFSSETVNGLDVRVEDVISNKNKGAATLVVGSDTTHQQKNNDDYFDDKSFVFHVNVVSGELKSLSVTYDEKRDKDTGDFPALELGQEINFPNKFINVKFDSVLNTDYVDFQTTFDEFDEEVIGVGDVTQKCVVIESTTDDSVEIGSTEETNSVYVCANSKAYYQDNDGDWYETTLNTVRLVNDKATYGLSMGPGSALRIVEPNGEFIELDTDFSMQKLGALDEESETAEVKYMSFTLGNRDTDILTPYGTVISDPKANGDNDEFLFSIPSDRVEAEVLVY